MFFLIKLKLLLINACMLSNNVFFFLNFFFKFNFFIIFLFVCFTFLLFIFTNTIKNKLTIFFFKIQTIVNFFLFISILFLLFVYVLIFFYYLKYFIDTVFIFSSTNSSIFKNIVSCKFLNLNLVFDFYGFILILLAFFVGFFALLVSDNKIKYFNTNFFFYFHYFLFIVYLFVSISDILFLFLFYELLLIPSFLFVYFISYTRKASQASLYFVIWTQLGSMLVLIGIIYLINLVGSSALYNIKVFSFTTKESYCLYCLFFFGFGFKFPIWPFHYWLTKTHVEASSGFSIYLSGFLVKSALFGFFKITNLICYEVETVLFSVIAFLGTIDASLKMWGQSDIKKLVAYCTIQEMNLILFLFLLGDNNSILCGIIFSATHAFLSTLMFFIVDCIYRRFHSRSIYNIQGLLHVTPNLAITIVGMCVLYAGLPGTLKFTCEFYIFSTLVEMSWASCILLLFIINVFGLIGFSKVWFTIIFGLPNNQIKATILDLSRKEIYIILYIFFFFFLINYISLFNIL